MTIHRDLSETSPTIRTPATRETHDFSMSNIKYVNDIKDAHDYLVEKDFITEKEDSDSEDEEEDDSDEPYHEYARRYDIDIKKKPHRRPIRGTLPVRPPHPSLRNSHHRGPRFYNDVLGLIFSFVTYYHIQDLRRVNRQWLRVVTARSTSSRQMIFDAQHAFQQLAKQQFKLSPAEDPHQLPQQQVLSLSLDQYHPLLDSLCASKYPHLTSLSYSTAERSRVSNQSDPEPPEVIHHSDEYHLSHAGTLSNQLRTLILNPLRGSWGHFPPLLCFLQLKVLIISWMPCGPQILFSDFVGLSDLHLLECFKYAAPNSHYCMITENTCAVLRYLSSVHSLRTLEISIDTPKLEPIYSRTRNSMDSSSSSQTTEEEEEEEEAVKVSLTDFTDSFSKKMLPHSRLTDLRLFVPSWSRSHSELIFTNLPNLHHFACVDSTQHNAVDGSLSAMNTTTTHLLESMRISIWNQIDAQRLEVFTNMRMLSIKFECQPSTSFTWMHSLRSLQELTMEMNSKVAVTFHSSSFASLSSLISLERLALKQPNFYWNDQQLDSIAQAVSSLPHFMILRLQAFWVSYLSTSFLISMTQSRMWRQVRLDMFPQTICQLFPAQQTDLLHRVSSRLFISPPMQQIRIHCYRYYNSSLSRKAQIHIFRLVQKTTKGKYRWKLVTNKKSVEG